MRRHDDINHRTRGIPGNTLNLHRDTGPTRPGCRLDGPERLAGFLLARFGRRLRTDPLWVPPGATDADRAVPAPRLDAARHVPPHASRISTDSRGVFAWTHQDGDEAPDARGGEVLGARAPAIERHAGRRSSVRRIPGVGGMRLDLAQASPAAGNPYGITGPLQRPHRGDRRPRALRVLHHVGARAAFWCLASRLNCY
jgi:hypothetical protein